MLELLSALMCRWLISTERRRRQSPHSVSSVFLPHPVGSGLVAAVDAPICVVKINNLRCQSRANKHQELRGGPEGLWLRTATGAGLRWTYDPGKRAGQLLLGHQLPLVRTEHRPLGDAWIHAADVHLVSVRKHLQARGHGERRPVGRPRGHRRVGDEQRRPVARTLLLEMVLTLFTD